MSWIGVKTTVLGVAAGGAAAVSLYAAMTPAAPSTAPVGQSRPAVTTTYAPCTAPAVLEGDECVIHESRTVSMTTAPAAVPAAPAQADDDRRTETAEPVETHVPVPATTAPRPTTPKPTTSRPTHTEDDKGEHEDHEDHEDGGEDHDGH